MMTPYNVTPRIASWLNLGKEFFRRLLLRKHCSMMTAKPIKAISGKWACSLFALPLVF
jgi:hypothetical protein